MVAGRQARVHRRVRILEDRLDVPTVRPHGAGLELGDVFAARAGCARPWARSASARSCRSSTCRSPNSPTRPSVSPLAMAKLTPSTALTSPTRRCSSPPRIGKCLTRPSTSSTGALTACDLPAGDGVPAAGIDERRRRGAAAIRRQLAARGEGAADDRPGQDRHQAGDLLQARPRARRIGLDVEPRDRPHQAARVGMQRVLEQRLDRRLLDLAAGIHHHDALGGLGDDAEIVGDQHDRRAGLLLELQHQVEDLRLDGDVERGGRLVGDQHLRIAGRAPWRS